MNAEAELTAESGDRKGNLFLLALLSILAGSVSGLVGAVFRLALEQGDQIVLDREACGQVRSSRIRQ